MYPPLRADLELSAAILWDPILLHSRFMPTYVLKCCHCGSLMNNSHLNDGSSLAKQPQMIYGLNDIQCIQYVSAMHICDKKYKILVHDQNILKLLPVTLIPFFLLHKTGFTKSFTIHSYTSFCQRGINPNQLSSPDHPKSIINILLLYLYN